MFKNAKMSQFSLIPRKLFFLNYIFSQKALSVKANRRTHAAVDILVLITPYIYTTDYTQVSNKSRFHLSLFPFYLNS